MNASAAPSDRTGTTSPPRTKKLPALRVGIGGPVGSGKTTLTEMLCTPRRGRYDLVESTNYLDTKHDQPRLTGAGALRAERIRGVEPGGCPHTAIHDTLGGQRAGDGQQALVFLRE